MKRTEAPNNVANLAVDKNIGGGIPGTTGIAKDFNNHQEEIINTILEAGIALSDDQNQLTLAILLLIALRGGISDWDATYTYSINDYVKESGLIYISIQNGNINNQPSTDGGVNWTLYVDQSVAQASSPTFDNVTVSTKSYSPTALKKTDIIAVTAATWATIHTLATGHVVGFTLLLVSSITGGNQGGSNFWIVNAEDNGPGVGAVSTGFTQAGVKLEVQISGNNIQVRHTDTTSSISYNLELSGSGLES